MVWEGDGERRSRLEVLREAFELSPFERDVLLLCTGVELDASFGWLCARAAGDPRCPYPTFALALAALPDPHWDAMAPGSAVRRWDLVEVEPGPVLTQARLRVPARVWQFLLAVDALDERLARYVLPLDEVTASASQDRVAEHAAQTARQGRAPVVQLIGRSRAGVGAVAVRCAEHLGAAPLRIPAEALPAPADELEQLGRVLRREAVLRPIGAPLGLPRRGRLGRRRGRRCCG